MQTVLMYTCHNLTLLFILDSSLLTCQSSIRLQNHASKFFLSSMGANYGSGSGQQVVTTEQGKTDNRTLWIVGAADRLNKPCRTGAPVKCGDSIRLEHTSTGKNLHSHSSVKGPISQRQEVSGFGDDGLGDAGDDWKIVCNERADYGPTKKEGEKITGKDLFHLTHLDSGCNLVSEQGYRFTNQNCQRCPIINHMECTCVDGVKQKVTLWKMDSGFFFPAKDDEETVEEEEMDLSSAFDDEL